MEARSSDAAKTSGMDPRSMVVSAGSASEKSGSITHDDVLNKKREARLLRTLDLRIIPILTIMYTCAFLDRINVGNAVVFGLEKDLKMNSRDYSNALSIFFVAYIVFELPSNILLKKFKPSVWLTSLMFVFGIITMIQGFVHSYSSLLACRFFLGVVEAGFLPGCFYVMAMWYKREESQKRFTFFFMSTALAGAFGGLLASAIGKMDGKQGMRGWRWIFIIEGVMTSVIAVVCYFIQPDFPEDVTWLSEEDRVFIQRRLAADVGESGRHDPVTLKVVLQQFKSLKFILGGIMYLSVLVPTYGYSFFGPTILNSFGYSPITTQLRSVPIQIVAICVALIVAFFSDHLQHRYLFILLSLSFSTAGYIALLVIHHNVHVQYGLLFLAVAGNVSAMPIIVCWWSTNLRSHTHRATGIAYQVSLGNFGGIISTYIYKTSDGPKFTVGYSVALGFMGLAALTSTLYYVLVRRENLRLEKKDIDDNLVDGEAGHRLFT